MGFLRRLFGGGEKSEGRSYSFTFATTKQEGDLPEGFSLAQGPRISVEGGFVVARVELPEGIDRSTVKLEPHGGSVKVSASGRSSAGAQIEFVERLALSNADESRAQLDWDGNTLVIRMPRG